MTPEEKRALAAFMRRFAKLMADRRALITILKTAADNQRPPTDWEKVLEELRQHPYYRAFLEQYEPTIRQLEEDAEIEALLPLFERMSEGKKPD
jgi:vacuolar-type H+-ATPase subunit C/Vma6